MEIQQANNELIKDVPKVDKVTQTLDKYSSLVTPKNLINFFKILMVLIGIILIFKVVMRMF